MNRLTRFLTLICATSLITGCAYPPSEPSVVVDDAANFCDVEEPRRFTRIELDWRAENAPDNLRKDHKTNETWDRECEAKGD